MNQHDLLVFLFGFIVGAFVLAWLTWSFLHARIEALEANLQHALHSRIDTFEALLSARWSAFQAAVAAHLHVSKGEEGGRKVEVTAPPAAAAPAVADRLESPHPRVDAPPASPPAGPVQPA